MVKTTNYFKSNPTLGFGLFKKRECNVEAVQAILTITKRGGEKKFKRMNSGKIEMKRVTFGKISMIILELIKG